MEVYDQSIEMKLIVSAPVSKIKIHTCSQVRAGLKAMLRIARQHLTLARSASGPWLRAAGKLSSPGVENNLTFTSFCCVSLHALLGPQQTPRVQKLAKAVMQASSYTGTQNDAG